MTALPVYTMHWTDTPIHVIDFEGSHASGVVEYGVVSLHKGTVTDVQTRICRPDAPPLEAELRVHGISAGEAGEMPPFSDERARFFALRESGVLCAHNAHVEMHLLKRAWPYPRLSPDFQNPGRRVADWGPWVDTLRVYELVFPALADHSVRALVESFDLQGQLDIFAEQYCPPRRRRYHCALYDALACALLLTRLGRLPGFEQLTLDWLLECSLPMGDEAAQQELFGE